MRYPKHTISHRLLSGAQAKMLIKSKLFVGVYKKLSTGALLLTLSGAAMLFSSGIARADILNTLDSLNQSEFKRLLNNVGAATHYKAIAPGEPLGVFGFEISAALSATDIDKQLFDLASAGDFSVDQFFLPGIHVHKGLIYNVDIGAFYSAIPDTNFEVLGAELRYSWLEGSSVTPAVAFRASFSMIRGVDELEVRNTAIEATISKGFLMFTPYAGIGLIRTVGRAPDIAALSRETLHLQKVYAGVNVNLGFNFGVEVDKTDDYTTYSIKAGIRF